MGVQLSIRKGIWQNKKTDTTRCKERVKPGACD